MKKVILTTLVVGALVSTNVMAESFADLDKDMNGSLSRSEFDASSCGDANRGRYGEVGSDTTTDAAGSRGTTVIGSDVTGSQDMGATGKSGNPGIGSMPSSGSSGTSGSEGSTAQ